MQVSYPPNEPTFKQSLLKKLFKRGKLPTVRKGLYGGELKPENVTDEHVVAKSKGGSSSEGNIALATVENNFKRGNKPLKNFLTQENIERYIEQFEGIELPNFNGNVYIRKLLWSIGYAMGLRG